MNFYVIQKFQYDTLYRLTKTTGREHASLSDTTPLPPGLESYTGDFNSSLMKEDGQALASYERKWIYDTVGNIVDMVHNANSGNNWTRHYSYDSSNNRLSKTTIGTTDYSYSHNVHGSMTSMPHLSAMGWDFAERLSQVTRGTTDAYYNYDGQGQRIRKVVVKGNVTETRLYLGGFEVYRKSIGGQTDTERETLHVMDDKKRIALVETLIVENGSPVANLVPVQRYQLDNHLGSASLELDETANVVSYEEYYPYGDTSYQAGRSASEVSQKRYRYTGKEKDEESGLYYHGARYYACWLGRWTASDPAGLVDGVNLYMYVRGNPVRLHDPSGNAGDEPAKIVEDLPGAKVTAPGKVTLPGVDIHGGEASLGGQSGSASGFFVPDASAVHVEMPQKERPQELHERKIYEINSKTGKASLLETQKTKDVGGVFIKRDGRLSMTSQKTIDEINSPSTAASPLIKFSIEILQADAKKYGGKFPVGYYAEYSRSVITESIRLYGPDKGIKEAGLALGQEVGSSPSKAPFHIFDSIARANDDSGWDKVQHFTRSATSQYQNGGIATYALQYGKEIFFDEVPSWFSSDKGYDPMDMLANNQGQAFGQKLFEQYHPMRAQMYSPSLLFRKQVSEPAQQWLGRAEWEIRNLYGLP